MAYYNVYFSPTGGTKKVADVVAKGIANDFVDIDLCKDIEKISLNKSDVCIVSVPSFGGRVPDVAVERIKKISANGAKAVLVCVYGNREWEDTLTELQDVLESVGFVCVSAISAVAEHSIFRQYATGRPDADDVTELKQFAQKINKNLTVVRLTNLCLKAVTAVIRLMVAVRSSQLQTTTAFCVVFVQTSALLVQYLLITLKATIIKNASAVCVVSVFARQKHVTLTLK